MNLVQTFIDALAAELTAKFGPLGYSVEAREPLEGELVATPDTKQIFITTDGLEFPEDEHATLGESTRVLVPVLVACVMQRPQVLTNGVLDVPRTVALAAKVLKRRLTLVQAVQRVRRDFAQTHSEVLVRPLQEQPQLVEGFYVSITGVEIEFDLAAEEQP